MPGSSKRSWFDVSSIDLHFLFEGGMGTEVLY